MIMVIALLVFVFSFALAEDMVSMTIPSFDGNPVSTQEKLDAEAGEWYESAVLNDDGSVTYVVSVETRDMILKTFVDEVDKGHNDMIESEDYPTFAYIERNDDFTSFKIGIHGKEVGMNEAFSSLLFFTESSMYYSIVGTIPDDVVVTFNSFDDGEILHEVKLSEMTEE